MKTEATATSPIQQKLLEAEEPARARLRQLQESVRHARCCKLLSFIDEHLYDPGFTIGAAMRAQGIRDKSFAALFRAKLGQPPAAFHRGLRMEISARLLCDAELKVHEIATAIGYELTRSFTDAFRSWSGLLPSRFQKLAQKIEKLEQDSASGPQPLEECLHGLRDEARGVLLSWLGRDSPTLRAWSKIELRERQQSSSSKVAVSVPSDFLDDAMRHKLPEIEELWEEIEEQPYEGKLRALCRNQHRFRTPALFYFLREASKLAAREDRDKGLELARLAKVAARLIELDKGGDGSSALEARAWIWYANQLRLKLDFQSAEQAFEAAKRCFPKQGEDLILKGEYGFWKAHLRWYERRFQEAFNFSETALSCFEDLGAIRMHGMALNLRGILHCSVQQFEDGLSDLDTASKHLDAFKFPSETLSACYNLARCLTEMENLERAYKAADKVEDLLSITGTNDFWEAMIIGMRGRLELKAESLNEAEILFSECRRRFLKLGRDEHAAIVSLDLAELYLKLGRKAEAELALSMVINAKHNLAAKLNVDTEFAGKLIL